MRYLLVNYVQSIRVFLVIEFTLKCAGWGGKMKKIIFVG